MLIDKIYRQLIIIGFCFLTVGSISAQNGQYSFKQLSDKGYEAYEKGHWVAAIELLTQAKEQNNDHVDELYYTLGDAAYQANSLAIAKENLEAYTQLSEIENEADARFKLAKIQHFSGSYQQAVTAYDLYLSEYTGQDAKQTMDAQFLKKSAEWASTATPEEVIESVNRLDNKYNTPESEAAPYLQDNLLYYSSMNYPIDDDDLKRYKSLLLKDTSLYNVPGVRQEQLVSNATFTPNGKRAFFTICDYVNDYTPQCALYTAKVNDAKELTDPIKLPEHINVVGTTNTHPTVKIVNDNSYLYYSSNRAGGVGQMDIYKSKFNSSLSFETPENVIKINTTGNDITPFYHIKTEQLYFSSDGREGYGGYDVYSINEQRVEPINLGKNINSPYNEIYYTLGEDEIRGHFTSNRPGSLYSEEKYETCCYDIYSAKTKKCILDLKTITYNKETKESLEGVNIKIVDTVTGQVYLDKVPASQENVIELPCSDNLKIYASKDGFEELEISLANLKDSFGKGEQITKGLYLQPLNYSLTVETFEKFNKKALNGCTVYLTDMSTMEQQNTVNNPGNLFTYPIKPNTKYLLEINKEGFKEKTIEFSSNDKDVRISKEAILEHLDIVTKSKISLANAIPVSLYFDNDMPRQGTTNLNSDKTYSETFNDYYNKKDKYKNSYLSLFKNSDMLTANSEIEYLFESNIKKGFDKYDVFKKQLLIVLEAGQDVNVYLRGYASPIAQSEYNTQLGKRRVDSVRKEFSTWNNGALIPHLESGLLKVTERSFGETTSPQDVSDDPSSPSKSIFSPEASKERRVEIDEIKFN